MINVSVDLRVIKQRVERERGYIQPSDVYVTNSGKLIETLGIAREYFVKEEYRSFNFCSRSDNTWTRVIVGGKEQEKET